MKKIFLFLSVILLFVSCKKEPVADFEVDGFAKAGVPVYFINHSSNSIKNFWDLGDGSSSTEESPTHTYLKPDNYEVTLYVVGENGYASSTKPVKITGTTFSFINNTSIDIPGFFTFYTADTTIQDLLYHGLLMKMKETNIISTSRSQVLFGFDSGTDVFFGQEIYFLTPDSHKTIVIDDFTQIYKAKGEVITIGNIKDHFARQQQ